MAAAISTYVSAQKCVTETSDSRSRSWRTQRMFALSPAEVTGCHYKETQWLGMNRCQPRRAPHHRPWNPLRWHCACVRVCLRPCLCIPQPMFGDLARPSAPALQCLNVLSGAAELPWRLVFSYMCAGMVPVAPAVGAVLAYLRLAHWWHAVWCDVCVVSSLAACIAP